MLLFTELNDNFFANPIFVGTIAVTVVLQFLIVNFGGVAFRCVPLSFEEWLVTVLIGFGSIPLGLTFFYLKYNFN